MHDPNNNNRLRVVSWNMCNHADGWAYLVEQLKPSIAFIQGATEIPSGINPILIHSGEEAASNTLIYACHNSPIELRSTVALGNGITAAYFSAPYLGGLFVFDGHSQSAPPIQAIKRFAKNLNPFVRWFRSSDPQHLLLSGGYQPEGLKEYGEHKRLKAPIVDARKDFEHGLAKIGFDTAENEPCKVCPLCAYRSPSLCIVCRDVNRCALLVLRPSWKHFRAACFPFETQSGSLLLLFGGNYARFAVGHSDTTFWLGLTLASSIEE